MVIIFSVIVVQLKSATRRYPRRGIIWLMKLSCVPESLLLIAIGGRPNQFEAQRFGVPRHLR
jgi:hypothetical protein